LSVAAAEPSLGSAAVTADSTPQVYQFRRPWRTLRYQLVKQHATSWLAEAKGE